MTDFGNGYPTEEIKEQKISSEDGSQKGSPDPLKDAEFISHRTPSFLPQARCLEIHVKSITLFLEIMGFCQTSTKKIEILTPGSNCGGLLRTLGLLTLADLDPTPEP